MANPQVDYFSKDARRARWSFKSRLQFGSAVVAATIGGLALLFWILGGNGTQSISFFEVPYGRYEVGVFADAQALSCYETWTSVPDNSALHTARSSIRYSWLGFAAWRAPRIEGDNPTVVGWINELEIPMWFIGISFAAFSGIVFRRSKRNRFPVEPLPGVVSPSDSERPGTQAPKF
jgi:hypothetical protein